MLENGEQEVRVIYAAADHVAWVRDVLPNLVADRAEQSPAEQLDECWLRFCLGEELSYGAHFKPLLYAGRGVWELKTIDLRIFGWFPQRDFFVAVVAEQKRLLIANRSYGTFIREVVAYRDWLPLDGDKFIDGEDPNGVVSNFAYA